MKELPRSLWRLKTLSLKCLDGLKAFPEPEYGLHQGFASVETMCFQECINLKVLLIRYVCPWLCGRVDVRTESRQARNESASWRR